MKGKRKYCLACATILLAFNINVSATTNEFIPQDTGIEEIIDTSSSPPIEETTESTDAFVEEDESHPEEEEVSTDETHDTSPPELDESENQREETVEEETEEIEEILPAEPIEENPDCTSKVIVYDLQELKAALTNPEVQEITLGADIDTSYDSLPVNHSVVIDGAGYKLIYHADLGAKGIYFGSDDLTIHYRNIFVDSRGLSQGMDGQSGIFSGDSHIGLSLILENVSYSGSQIFYLPGFNNQMIFRGKNRFNLLDNSSTTGFAEVPNLIFEEGSSTMIVDEHCSADGLIATYQAPLNFTVGASATVDIQTKNDFLASESMSHSITVNQDGLLRINQRDELGSQANGRLIHQSNQEMQVNVFERGTLELRLKNASTFSAFNAYFGPDSISELITGGSSFFGGSWATLTIDNAERLRFQSESGTSGMTGPIGMVGRIHFSDFYTSVTGYQTLLDGTEISQVNQMTTDEWYLGTDGFYRPGIDFDGNQQVALKNATQIEWQKGLPQPPVLSWEEMGIQKTNRLTIDKYDLLKMGEYRISFYWQGVSTNQSFRFKLYDEAYNELALAFEGVTETSEDFQKIEIGLSEEHLPYGKHRYFIEMYSQYPDGSQSSQAVETLTLELEVVGSLRFERIPSQLKWTSHSSSEAIGLLSRDDENQMGIGVIDSRENPGDWQVRAVVQQKSIESSVPFTLAWKSDVMTQAIDLDGAVVLSKEESQRSECYFSNTWDSETGVLLESQEQLVAGDYSNQLMITWILESNTNPSIE